MRRGTRLTVGPLDIVLHRLNEDFPGKLFVVRPYEPPRPVPLGVRLELIDDRQDCGFEAFEFCPPSRVGRVRHKLIIEPYNMAEAARVYARLAKIVSAPPPVNAPYECTADLCVAVPRHPAPGSLGWAGWLEVAGP